MTHHFAHIVEFYTVQLDSHVEAYYADQDRLEREDRIQNLFYVYLG